MLSLIGLTQKINIEKLSPSFVVIDLMSRTACAVLKERRRGIYFGFWAWFFRFGGDRNV